MMNKGTMSSKNFSPSKRGNNATFVCRKCQNPTSHKAHHPECEHSNAFKKAKLTKDASKMKISEHFTNVKVMKALPSSKLGVEACDKNNNPSPVTSPSSKPSQIIQKGPALFSNSLSKVQNPYKKKLLSPMPPIPQPQSTRKAVSHPSKLRVHSVVLKPPPPPQKPKLSFVPPFLSPSAMDISEKLKALVKEEMKDIRTNKKKKIVKVYPQVDVVIDYIRKIIPSNFEAASSSRAIQVKEQYDEARKYLPINSCSFTIPCDATTSAPDSDYTLIEDITIYLLH